MALPAKRGLQVFHGSLFARDDNAFRIDIAGYHSNREMHCLSLLATLLVP